jgi:hypothetical protein
MKFFGIPADTRSAACGAGISPGDFACQPLATGCQSVDVTMHTLSETSLKPRQRSRLRRARENGYLDARSAESAKVHSAYGLWCWRLGLPLVWFERHSPRSRYGTVRLDLLTSANRLSEQGQAEMHRLAPGPVNTSPHDAAWGRVPLKELEQLAARVLRAAVRAGNAETERPRLIEIQPKRRGPAKIIELEKPRSAFA